MNFANKNNVMIDLETLAARSDAAIVSIGAVKFNFTDGIVTDTFNINVSAESCKRHNLFIDKETVEWWGKQSKEARQAWMKDPVPLDDAIQSFNEWYGKESLPTWSLGAAFDVPILEYTYKKCFKSVPPWKYFDVYCCRTVFNMAGYNLKKEREAAGNYHMAVEDARAQALALIKVLNGS